MDLLITGTMILTGLWLADLTTAGVHWVVDNYADPDWPIIGPYYVAHSHDHHDHPMKLLELSFWECHWFILSFAAVTASGLALFGWLNPLTISALVFGASTNLIHGWSHRSAEENGPVITALHRLGLLQSPSHHVHHHSDDNAHYALLTDHINPVLEASRIFPFFEAQLARIGLHRHWWLSATTANA